MGAKKTAISLKDAASLCAMEVTIPFEDGTEEKVWVRTPTDLERQQASIAKLEARGRFRKMYVDGAPAYEELKETVRDYGESQLAAILAKSEMPALAEKARRNCGQLIEPDWTKYTTDEQRDQVAEEYNARQEEYERKVVDELNRLISEKEESLIAKESLDSMRERVLRITISQTVTQHTEARYEMLGEKPVMVSPGFDEEYLIFHSFYQMDKQTRYFDSIEQVRDLNDAVKMMLFGYARSVNFVGPSDIKNLLSRSEEPTGPAETTQALTTESSTTGSQESGSRKKSSRGGRKQSGTDSA